MPRTATPTPKTVIDRHELGKFVALMSAIENAADGEYVAIEGQLKVYVENDETGERTDLIGTISFSPADGYNVPKFVVPR